MHIVPRDRITKYNVCTKHQSTSSNKHSYARLIMLTKAGELGICPSQSTQLVQFVLYSRTTFLGIFEVKRTQRAQLESALEMEEGTRALTCDCMQERLSPSIFLHYAPQMLAKARPSERARRKCAALYDSFEMRDVNEASDHIGMTSHQLSPTRFVGSAMLQSSCATHLSGCNIQLPGGSSAVSVLCHLIFVFSFFIFLFCLFHTLKIV